MAAPASGPSIAALIREALEADKVSVKELARRLAKDAGTGIESERRGLQRYLKGEVTPEPDKAAAIARALGRKEAPFVAAVEEERLGPSLRELLLANAVKVDNLAEQLRLSDQRLRGARAQNRVVGRLRALEAQVAEQGKAMTEALTGLAAEVRGESPSQQNEARSATPRRARR